MNDILKAHTRLERSYKAMAANAAVWLAKRRRQGVCDTTTFTVCDEPGALSDTDVTPCLHDLLGDRKPTTAGKKTHLQRGGFDRWNFKGRKR